MSDTTATRLRHCVEQLRQIAVGSARLEAQILINHAGHDNALLEKLIQRRIKGEPVDRIVGRRGFWTLELLVSPDVLSPRPDTETVVELARDLTLERTTKAAPFRILDLGTGSGAILLALLAEFPQATGIGLDISPAALDIATRNAELNGLADRVQFIQGDWDQAFAYRFELVVSNPPYIPTADLASLEREVIDHDPRIALDGGKDGLDPYRQIFPRLHDLLTPDGVAIVEIGYGQDQSIPALARALGLKIRQLKNDLAGIPRALALSHQV